MLLLNSFPKVRLLISVSSGGRDLTISCDATTATSFQNVFKNCGVFNVAGFTEMEAKKYLTIKDNTSLTLEEVYPYTGLNLLLLSLIVKCGSISKVKSTVSAEVDRFMLDNLKLKKNCENLADYVMKQNLIETLELTYCACRRGKLDEYMEDKFTNSWLGKHHLAVVDDVWVETSTVLEDQDDKTVLEDQDGETSATNNKFISERILR